MKKSGIGPYPDCKSCQMLYRRMQGLRARNGHLLRELQATQALLARAQDRIRELEQAKRPTASNSSLSPSANPIGAPSPVKKKPTGQKQGAQIGHKGKARKLLSVERMHHVVQHRPQVCRHCNQPIDASADGQVVGRHQVAELPPVAVELTEHQSLSCRCRKCGRLSAGQIPPEIAASVIGPRLTGAIGLLGACVKGSKRAVAQVLEQMLGCPLALGSVINREKELSLALAGPYQELVGATASARVKYVDETGWKLKGKSHWLFVGAAREAVVFRIEKSRTRPAFLRLLGGKARGFFCSDRCGIYDLLRLEKRGLCWSHLRRDFTAVVERGGAGEEAGKGLLEVSNRVFGLWRDFKQRQLTRTKLKEEVEKLAAHAHGLLEKGAGCGQKKTVGLCKSLLKRESALWRFAQVSGLEPTNNLAERMLRGSVIWRKKSFGSQSQEGCRFVERVLSVTQTLALSGRSVLDYLEQAVRALRQKKAAPAIVTSSKAVKPAEDGALSPPLPSDLRKVA